MAKQQNQPLIGKTCRWLAASSAAARAAPSGASHRAVLAQFPPQALFTALQRAGRRQTARARLASGTRLANWQLPAAGGTAPSGGSVP
jgi:hypothetical protein